MPYSNLRKGVILAGEQFTSLIPVDPYHLIKLENIDPGEGPNIMKIFHQIRTAYCSIHDAI